MYPRWVLYICTLSVLSPTNAVMYICDLTPSSFRAGLPLFPHRHQPLPLLSLHFMRN